MNQETLTALKGSIEKWKKIVAGTGEDHGQENCPLCALFYKDDGSQEEDKECVGCPVMKKTGDPYCTSSPYVAWLDASPSGEIPTKASSPALLDAAKQELAFLKSLLPKAAA